MFLSGKIIYFIVIRKVTKPHLFFKLFLDFGYGKGNITSTVSTFLKSLLGLGGVFSESTPAHDNVNA